MNKLILFTLIVLTIIKQGSSFEAERLPASLPTPRFAVASVYDGDDSVLLLGGIHNDEEYLDEVVQFKLSTGEVQVVGRFPTPIGDGSAQLNPNGLGAVYLGGITRTANYEWFTSYIWTTSPNQVNPNPAGNLHERHGRACSARDPNTGSVYEIGGQHGHFGILSNIVKYNGSSVEVIATLPFGIAYCASTWFNDSLYIFGGFNDVFEKSRDIIKFTPGLDELVVMPTKLNADFTSGAAVTDGKYIYLIGGLFADSLSVVIYDPQNDILTQESVSNLPRMQNFGAIYTNKTNRIYLFGGRTRSLNGVESDQIHYISL